MSCLQKTADDLPADIVFVCFEQRGLNQLVRAASNVVFGLNVFSCRKVSVVPPAMWETMQTCIIGSESEV